MLTEKLIYMYYFIC